MRKRDEIRFDRFGIRRGPFPQSEIDNRPIMVQESILSPGEDATARLPQLAIAAACGHFLSESLRERDPKGKRMAIPERLSEKPDYIVHGADFAAGVWQVQSGRGPIRYGVWLIPGGYLNDYATPGEAMAVADALSAETAETVKQGKGDPNADDDITPPPGFH